MFVEAAAACFNDVPGAAGFVLLYQRFVVVVAVLGVRKRFI
jgi:hypothetical protein